MSTIFLSSAFSLILPDPGLALWTIIIFAILWLVLGKFAFKPIIKSLNDRSNNIQNSLDEAKRAREEMAALTAKNEDLLKEAKEERNILIAQAKETANEIIEKAKEKAKVEAKELIEDAKREIEIQKVAAMTEVKNHVGAMAVNIAESLVKKELSDKSAQEELVKKLVAESKMN